MSPHTAAVLLGRAKRLLPMLQAQQTDIHAAQPATSTVVKDAKVYVDALVNYQQHLIAVLDKASRTFPKSPTAPKKG